MTYWILSMFVSEKRTPNSEPRVQVTSASSTRMA